MFQGQGKDKEKKTIKRSRTRKYLVYNSFILGSLLSIMDFYIKKVFKWVWTFIIINKEM